MYHTNKNEENLSNGYVKCIKNLLYYNGMTP